MADQPNAIFLQNSNPSPGGANPINLRCPHCRHMGAFHGLNNIHDASFVGNFEGKAVPITFGIRKCPNRDCSGLVFVSAISGKVARCFPPEIIDFDATNLPDNILRTLEESILCHSVGAYRASALMVRRVLEELCDNKGITGKDLKARLLKLGEGNLIPPELFDAADELRVLGNDAAHVQAKEYNDIGEREASIGIELTKEILKSVYQLSSLLDRLRSLKKP